MPQLFQVLRCYKCVVFQVHQTKKSNKFACKLCGEKQSIKRHFGLGTAKDCRLHVQKLNGIKGEVEKMIEHNRAEIESNEEAENECENIGFHTDQRPKTSKWSDYVDKEETIKLVSDNDKTMYLGSTEVVLDVPQKRFKSLRRNKNSKCKNFNPPKNVNECKEVFFSSEILPQNDNSVTPHDTNIPLSLECASPVQNTDSKCIHFESKHVKIMKEEESIPCKKVLQPKISNNSKWAQFIDAEADDESGDESTGNIHNNPQTLFSLCDDTDLDNVLDI